MKPPARLSLPAPPDVTAVSRLDGAGFQGTPAATIDDTHDVAIPELPEHAPHSGNQPQAELRTRPLLPPAYRGKTSGQFRRAASEPQAATTDKHSARSGAVPHRVVRPTDVGAIVSLAQTELERLPAADERRRLLELGILRRDPALLTELLRRLGERQDG